MSLTSYNTTDKLKNDWKMIFKSYLTTTRETIYSVKDYLRRFSAAPRDYFLAFFKWLGLASVAGLFCGIIGAGFHLLLNIVGTLQSNYSWLLYLLPVAGLAIVFCYCRCGAVKPLGTNLIIQSIQSDSRIPPSMAPLIFLGTLLTHLCGGSAGREGAALQLGGSLGSLIGKLFKLNENDTKVIIQCGMSAVFSALFGTPVAAAVFSMEVISIGIMHYSAFFPCIVAALIASGISALLGIAPTTFSLAVIPSATLSVYAKVILLAALCALCSILFILTIHGTSVAYKHFFENQYIRVAVGGLLVIAVTLFIGNRDYNGAGMAVVERAIDGSAVPWAFLLKILLTALTLSAGFKGGEIVPSFFIGATFGCTVGGLLGLEPGFSAAVGLIAVFCGVVNCPITALILSVELFGGAVLPFMAPSCAVAYILSGSFSLYTSQRIVYSKLQNRYVNTEAHTSILRQSNERK